MQDILDAQSARAFLLGADFDPKRTNIDTPDLLLAKGFPAESLMLVGLPATAANEIDAATVGNVTLRGAMYLCSCLHWRSGGSPIFMQTDAPTLCQKDIDLLNAFVPVVNGFLTPPKKVVDETKNGSQGAPSTDGPPSDGGSESPSPSDSPQPEHVSEL
jgi:hypothetical protein